MTLPKFRYCYYFKIITEYFTFCVALIYGKIPFGIDWVLFLQPLHLIINFEA